MNFAHLHLILNHVPVLTLIVSLIFLFFSFVKKSERLKKFSLLMTFLTSITILPVFYTGEPAEEVVEKMPMISKTVIHNHEESAEVSLVLTLLVSISSLLVLVTYKKPVSASYGIQIVLLFGVIAIGSLAYTANLGGKIRHTEFVTDIGNRV